MAEQKLEFMYIIRPHKENFAETMTEEDARIMGIHFEYLKDIHAKGTLILAGPVLTGEMGIAIIEADSEEEARKIMENDPAVLNGIVTPSLYPYRVSLLRGRN
jgi:uncharacterized protein